MRKLQQILLGSIVGLTIVTAGPAFARDRDHDGRPDNSWAEHHDRDGYKDNRRYDRRMERREERHDRYWRHGYRNYVSHDRVYRALRRHHYSRWEGEPYWYRGHYVVRSYNRYGHVVYVEVNPYTADFIGVIRF